MVDDDNKYQGTKYNNWEIVFGRVFLASPPDINNEKFDEIVKPILKLQTRFSRAKEAAIAKAKGIIGDIMYNQIPLRL